MHLVGKQVKSLNEHIDYDAAYAGRQDYIKPPGEVGTIESMLMYKWLIVRWSDSHWSDYDPDCYKQITHDADTQKGD